MRKERLKILELLREEKISVDDALELMKTMGNKVTNYNTEDALNSDINKKNYSDVRDDLEEKFNDIKNNLSNLTKNVGPRINGAFSERKEEKTSDDEMNRKKDINYENYSSSQSEYSTREKLEEKFKGVKENLSNLAKEATTKIKGTAKVAMKKTGYVLSKLGNVISSKADSMDSNENEDFEKDVQEYYYQPPSTDDGAIILFDNNIHSGDEEIQQLSQLESKEDKVIMPIEDKKLNEVEVNETKDKDDDASASNKSENNGKNKGKAKIKDK